MAQQFYVKINNVVHGPLTGQKLQEMAQSGQISPTDEVRLTNSQTLHPAGNIKGLQFALAPGEKDSQQTAPPSPPEKGQEVLDLGVSIPEPPAYPTVSFFIGLYNLCAGLGILAGVFGSIIVIKEGKPELIIPLVIGTFFYAAFCFLGAQLLELAADSARNLHRLTHSNRRIMESIVNNKK